MISSNSASWMGNSWRKYIANSRMMKNHSRIESSIMQCHCGILIALKTAGTSGNEGIRFYSCPNTWGGRGDCGLFVWANNENEQEIEKRKDPFDPRIKKQLEINKCSCRRWCLSGVPCFHACASIFKNREDPTNYVHSLLSKETCLATYDHRLMPIVGPMDWPKTELCDVVPPPEREMKGRHNYEKGGSKRVEPQLREKDKQKHEEFVINWDTTS
ncbi:hypothetical protein ACFE04_004345 [Oxalis oulophora]